MKHCIKGFHFCEHTRKCNAFVDKQLAIVATGPSQWLGDGMYFWDNYGNALYWRRELNGDHIPEKDCMVTADIDMDYVLDLTDEETQVRINRAMQDILQIKKVSPRNRSHRSLRNKISKDEELTPGQRLDYLLKYSRYRDELRGIKVVKATGRHPRLNDDNKVLSSLWGKKWPRPVVDTKIEYCVKDESAISSPAWIDDATVKRYEAMRKGSD